MNRALLIVVPVALAFVGGAIWWSTRTESIPEVLEAVEDDPAVVEIPGREGQPPLTLQALEGKTTFFVVIGTWSAKSPEGEATNRALSRWTYPEDVTGFIVADAGGMGVFSDRIEATMASYAKEMRFPLYVDYEGVFVDTFKLPKGHHGLVVLGPEGEIMMRHSGGLEGAGLEELRTALRAREPEPGAPMPQLQAGALGPTSCAEIVCAFVFAGPEPVKTADIPGIRPGGFEGDDDARLAQMLEPAVRLVTLARKMKLTTAKGALIGDLEPAITTEGWERLSLDDGAQTREALGLGDEPAVVVYERGREVLRATGLVPLHQWGRIADLLEVEGFNDRRPPRG